MTKVLYTCYRCGKKTDSPIEERENSIESYVIRYKCKDCNEKYKKGN